jgi:acetoin utilization protein AcuB
MLVRDCMSSKVISVERQDPIEAARALLRKHRIRQLPVMRGERLVGIVTDRDLRSAAGADAIVNDVMTAKPVVVRPEAPIDEAAQSLRALKVGALPVVENKRVVGILTASDVLSAFVELSGVTEPTYHMTLSATDGLPGDWQIRRVISNKHGEVKWMHRDKKHHPNRVHLRLKTRNIEDIVDALAAAGLEVGTMVAPATRRRR